MTRTQSSNDCDLVSTLVGLLINWVKCILFIRFLSLDEERSSLLELKPPRIFISCGCSKDVSVDKIGLYILPIRRLIFMEF